MPTIYLTSVESEIAQLEQQLAQKRAALEQQPGAAESIPSEKELLRQTIGEKIQNYTSPASQQPAPAPVAQPAPAKPGDDQPSYASPELQGPVQELVNVAFTKGIDEAIQQAIKTNNSALIDAFHDVIVDELLEQMLERKKLDLPKE